MNSWRTNLAYQLEELHLVRCSLLPGETFAFTLPHEDLVTWTSLLDAFADTGVFNASDEEAGMVAPLADPPCPARFQIRVVGAPVWFEVALPACTDQGLGLGGATESNPRSATTLAMTSISVRCARDVSRDEQERWYAEIRAQKAAADDGLPDSDPANANPNPFPSPFTTPTPTPSAPWHALLTSHHLVSPTKRRALRQWSAELGVAGFAKIGYPGVIYAEGPREGVETFVRNVKGMQWLALRVRFLEVAPTLDSEQEGGWVEVSKIGEVLEQMKIRGREALVTNLGIGAPSKEHHS